MSPRKKDADSAATISRIREAVMEVLKISQPRDAFSIRDVAQRANLSPGTVTYYFATKEDILRDVLVEHTARLNASIAGLMQRNREFENDVVFLEAVIGEMYAFAMRERLYMELVALLDAQQNTLSKEIRSGARLHIKAAAMALGPRVNLEPKALEVALWACQSWIVKMATMSEEDLEEYFGDGEEAEASRLRLVIDTALRCLHPIQTSDA